MPLTISEAAAPASACACCTSAASAFTRRPSIEVAMTIGGTASSVSIVNCGEV